MNIRRLLWLMTAALSGTACDASSFAETATAAEGIYQVSNHVRNDQVCEPQGEPIPGHEDLFVVFKHTQFGMERVTLVSCGSVEECVAKRSANAVDAGAGSEFTFGFAEADGTDLVGYGVSTGFGLEGLCAGGEVSKNVLTLEGDSIQVVKTWTSANDYPTNREGFCTTDGAKRASEGNQCARQETLAGFQLDPP